MTETHAPKPPLYLTGVSTAEARAAGRADLGVLCQPGNSTHLDVEHYPVFGADNGFYGIGARRDPSPGDEEIAALRWLDWLEKSIAPIADRCLFATVPDVLRWITLEDGKRIPVGDAEATLARFPNYAPTVRAFGLKAALVAQDGLLWDDDGVFAGAERVAWDDFDSLFVGGSTEFKLAETTADLCRAARERGKWIHVGRVNSWKRIAAVRDYADSVDGTFLGFAPRTNWPRLLAWLDRLVAEPTLFAA